MLSPFSAAELGLDFTHKITLELPKKFKIVFENDGTSKSYVYTEFKHLVKDETKSNYYWDYYWEKSSNIPLTTLNSNKHCYFSPSFDTYESLYNNLNLLKKGKSLKFLGAVINKEELYNTNYELGSIVFCEEDNNTYALTYKGWEVIQSDITLSTKRLETLNEQSINKNNEPTFHEESYWEYVEVKK